MTQGGNVSGKMRYIMNVYDEKTIKCNAVTNEPRSYSVLRKTRLRIMDLILQPWKCKEQKNTCH